MTDRLLLLAHAGATVFMVGLIWFVQVVHYPLFAGVGREGFAAYHALHSRRTGWVVGPVMAAEALCALALLVRRPAGVRPGLALAGLVLLGVVQAGTAFLAVPRHGVLGGGFDERTHVLLVATNWVRTAGWTARGVLALAMVGATMRA